MAITFTLNGTIREKLITEVFIPQIRKSLVASNFMKTGFDAKAKSVKIWGVGDVSTSNWDGGRLTATTHTNTSIDLVVDQGKSFAQDVHRVDNEDSAINVLQPVLEEGSYQIANDIDTYAFATLAGTSTSATGTFTALDETNVKSFVGAMGVALDNAGAPSSGRRLAITPEVADLLSDVVATLGNNEAAGVAIAEGFVGRYKGFDIYKTINLADAITGKWAIATVETGAALGIGYSEASIDPVNGSPVDVAWGATQYGAKVVKDAFVIKADVALA